MKATLILFLLVSILVSPSYNAPVPVPVPIPVPVPVPLPGAAPLAIENSLKDATILQVAFSALEKDNPIALQYTEITGVPITPFTPMGIPYFFGGSAQRYLLEPWPAWQSSNYFKKDSLYIYGFDCRGYVNWVLEKSALPKIGALNVLLHSTQPEHIARRITINEQPFTAFSMEQWKNHLIVGDFFVMSSVGRHIGMYIGTLRHYGYQEDNISPNLAPYLDFPLMIHCGVNPKYAPVYQKYIEEIKSRGTITTDGGVTVSIVNVPLDAADYEEEGEFYFDIGEGYDISIYNLQNRGVVDFAVYR